MRRALELAARGWGRVSPNPLAGAVVVRDGDIVGEGFHEQYGGPHAEVAALNAAGAAARDATLYVTLEPCAHYGKTPPCTTAIRQAGIARVVIAAADPNPVAAGGAEWLRSTGIEVETGLLAEEARDQNAPFFHAHPAGAATRPWLALKLALTLDARISDASGRSAWITGPEARAEVHRLRAGYDAIAVGSGTVIADDPLLTVRGAVQPRNAPLRVVFDRRLRTPPGARLLSAEGAPLLFIAGPAAEPGRAALLRERGAEVEAADTLDAALSILAARGIRSLFVEGGAAVATSLLERRLVDRLYLFYAPLLLGGGLAAFDGLPAATLESAERWRMLGSASFGADTLITLGR